MTVRILCVEDNPQNMRLVRKILKSQGYEVLEAEDGFSGLTMAETQNPDLILMDVNLPDIDGLEVTRRIKAQEHLRPIPIVALTANAMFGDEERCLEAGCDGYIAKPVSKQKLLLNLKNYLALIPDDEVDDTGSKDLPAIINFNESASKALESPATGDSSMEPIVELENSNFASSEKANNSTSTGPSRASNDHHPNISAFRKANQRHRFRPSATASRDESKAASKNQDKDTNDS